MAAGALIFNRQGEILIVKPNYKDHWSIPGGTTDRNESPRDSCLREVREEVGLKLRRADFVCVDYIPKNGEKNESLQFLFYCGTISGAQIRRIKLQKSELDEYRFLTPGKARSLLNRHLAGRLAVCIRVAREKRSMYLENNAAPRGR